MGRGIDWIEWMKWNILFKVVATVLKVLVQYFPSLINNIYMLTKKIEFAKYIST